jgi:hypothetical protein
MSRLRLPSPAMAVALLALFVALGGTGYAVTKINGKNLKDRSVPAKKLKKDQLSGTEINESKLGKVPSAAEADHAAAADNATNATNATNAQTAANATEAAHAASADVATDTQRVNGVNALLLNNANSKAATSCDPDVTDLFPTKCATVNLGVPQTSHVLVIATGNWYGTTGTAGSCRIERDGVVGQSLNLGQNGAPHDTAAHAAAWSLTQDYVNVPQGGQAFDVVCVEDAGDLKLANIKIVAVRLAMTSPMLIP